jgi:hypothetical protein
MFTLKILYNNQEALLVHNVEQKWISIQIESTGKELIGLSAEDNLVQRTRNDLALKVGEFTVLLNVNGYSSTVEANEAIRQFKDSIGINGTDHLIEDPKPPKIVKADTTENLKKMADAGSKKVGELVVRIKKHKRSPEVRARAAGRYLAQLASVWGVLSIIGAIILVLQRNCLDDSYGECWAYEYPYATWAIVSLLVNLIVASFMYAVGTYIEAKMSRYITE